MTWRPVPNIKATPFSRYLRHELGLPPGTPLFAVRFPNFNAPVSYPSYEKAAAAALEYYYEHYVALISSIEELESAAKAEDVHRLEALLRMFQSPLCVIECVVATED